MAQRRKSRRRGPSLEARVERAGHVALTTAWSTAVRVIGGSLRWLRASGAAAYRWFAGRSRTAQLGALLALGLAAWAAVRYLGRERAIYIHDDVEALARVIHSECGTCSNQQQLHIAWATRNLAESQHQSVAEMVCSPCGPQERGRPVSSRQAANDTDREMAKHVLDSPALADPTGRATHFINPRLQDELAAAGDRPGYRGNSYQVVRQRWMNSYGWEPYYRLGDDLELWGTKREPKAKRKHRPRRR